MQNLRPVAGIQFERWNKMPELCDKVQNLVIWYAIKKYASFVYIIFAGIKWKLVLKFKETWFIQTKRIFIRILNDKILHIESHISIMYIYIYII